MDKARYLVEAHLEEGRSVSELSAMHGVHRSWIYKLLARYRAGGEEALAARSRRPRSCPHKASKEIEQVVVELRHELSRNGHDAGAHTIAYHLAKRFDHVPSVATIWRILKRNGLVEAQPQKRPKSSLIRFCAELPNQMWQADFTHWRLADGSEVEILNFEDDHSRLFLASDVYLTVTAQDVVSTFQKACDYHGYPASLLTDNGAVFTGHYRGGKVLLESELERLGVVFKNSRPYHPQTCGKVERLHQTLKKYLAKQRPAKTLDELQHQLDTFRDYYNNIRPHRALDGCTPLQAFEARVKAKPSKPIENPHFRVRKDKVDKTGRVTLRHDSRLHHIALGRAHKGRRVTILVADLDIRVVDEEGEVIRQLTLDPSRNYQPLGST
ncbi:MAG: IS481 family transposase [Pseudohongiella sp.]|uniref:IS481 family transposase n=1 Tax=Pseudohongiella sp. TaxID=1979412 RepID=UPI0034A0816A